MTATPGCFFLVRLLVLLAPVLLSACAANQLHGFENVYYSYNVPQPLFDRIKVKFREYGLGNATVVRDNVGRVRLAGSYRNEDEVDLAYVIVQSIVGQKATSPFYPENIKEKRWEIEAAKAMAAAARTSRLQAGPPRKVALVIGINKFSDPAIPDIQGEDDGTLVAEAVRRQGYAVTALLGPAATKQQIERALRSLEEDVRPNDDLFIYISSHGTQPIPSYQGKDARKMSIVAYDSGTPPGGRRGSGTDERIKLQRTAVSDLLVQQVARKPSRNTRILIDTCYSGEILNDVADDSRQFILKNNGGQPERAGVSLAAWSGPEYSSKSIAFVADNAGTSASEKSRAAALDRTRKGYTIVTATSENEESLGPDTKVGEFTSPLAPERKLKGSFFTQAFFEFLNQHQGQIQPAFEDARSFTALKAREVSRGTKQQVPRMYTTSPAAENNLYR